MAVSLSSTVVNVTAYKAGVTGTSGARTIVSTTGVFSSGDVGRFIAIIPSSTNSGFTQVRRITSYQSTTQVTMQDDWVGGAPDSGTDWRMSHNLQDVHDIGSSYLQKTGARSYRWAGHWNVYSSGFLADVDCSLEMESSASPGWPIAAGGIVQFGVLWGGEANGSNETTNGCSLVFAGARGNQSVYSNDNSRSGYGGVTNYYGCLIDSRSSENWMFQRMTGPTRFIGTTLDGIMGGRFYHEASEWVQSRVAGNDNATPAWSIGATFTRPIDSVSFFQNDYMSKNNKNFGGTWKNCYFSDSNGYVISIAGTSGSIFNYIDCTEFPDSKISDGGSGILNQYRSINFLMTSSSGVAKSGVALRVNDKDDATQGAIETSDVSGICGEILALRRKWSHSSPSVLYNPFRMRIRSYGFYYASLNSAVTDPIKQSYAILADPNVSQASGTALAHTGISIAMTAPVAWNSKNWSITVTGNKTTNPGLTAEDIKHYLHYHLAQDANIGSRNGLEWHNLIPMAGTATELGDYGGTDKGVRVIDESGNPFPGITKMQADDGTIYSPPVIASLTLTGLITGSDVVVLEAGTSTVLASVDEGGASYVYTYSSADTVDIGIIKPGYVPLYIYGVVLAGVDSSIPINQSVDRNYK